MYRVDCRGCTATAILKRIDQIDSNIRDKYLRQACEFAKCRDSHILQTYYVVNDVTMVGVVTESILSDVYAIVHSDYWTNVPVFEKIREYSMGVMEAVTRYQSFGHHLHAVTLHDVYQTSQKIIKLGPVNDDVSTKHDDVSTKHDDAYQCGLLIFELSTGHPCDSEYDVTKQLRNYLNSDADTETGSMLIGLICDCLTADPIRRPTSGEILARLRGIPPSVNSRSFRSVVQTVITHHINSNVLLRNQVSLIVKSMPKKNNNRYGSVERVIEMITVHVHDDTLVRHACLMLANLSIDVKCHFKLLEQRALCVLVQAYEIHSRDLSLCRYLCRLFANLCIDVQSSTCVVNAGVIPHVIHSMTTFGSDIVLIRTACRMMANVCTGALVSIVALSGVIPVMTSSIDMHGHDVVICRNCCRMLSNLSANVDGFPLVSISRVIDTVLRIMDMHTTDVSIIRHTCLMVANVSISSDNAMMMVESEVLEHMTKIMDEYDDDVIILQHAVYTLADLCVGASISSRMYNIGVVQRMTRVMEHHIHHAILQQDACRVLGNLCIDANNVILLMKEYNVLHYVTRAMDVHGDDPSVISCAIHVLANMSVSDVTDETLGESGVIRKVVDAMIKHSDDVIIARNGCLLMSNLSVNNNNKRRLYDDGGVDVVMGVIDRFHDDVVAIQNSLVILVNVTVKQELAVYLSVPTVVHRVLSVLRRHGDDVSVVQDACRVLIHMSLCDVGMRLLKETTDVVQCLRDVVDKCNDGDRYSVQQLMMVMSKR